MSARHQVNGRIVLFAGSLAKIRSGRRNEISSFVAGPVLRFCNFTSGLAVKVKSGPDVFADALVLLRPGYCRHSFPDIVDLTATWPRCLMGQARATTSSLRDALARFPFAVSSTGIDRAVRYAAAS
ncbi:hypothetical protein AC629_24835 [Bradyrhizobium sp. NAS80.1]|nr:hypothetical protein AC629_24835 [Bradyrhizobium sp. NAS80.1]